MRTPWLLTLTLVLGCASTVGPDLSGTFAVAANLGEPFTLKVGQRARIDDADLAVRFVEVVGDSRCPSNALILCVWEGDGAILVEIAPLGGGDARADTLHTTLDPKWVLMGTVLLELLQVDPYPTDFTPIPLDAYEATFTVRMVR
ncbi:MAG: hypothetical protein OEO20_13695 [Gemmatimonadota bacterium]|nr:hypothetical protein [Gemmatimonadota bacterium]MDH3479344.1 hypothetical protein [Gemmatimonadota bacterium]MDH3569459.1 hypothetical protein [Gemmatimonadota bacterium]